MAFLQPPKNQGVFHSCIDVNVRDYVLTPLSCASLVNELLKNLLYQKSQIPYPYAWLKNIVGQKRRKSEENQGGNSHNLVLSRHYQTVSTVFDGLESIMQSIEDEFSHCSNNLKEIVVVFGVTPACPKEVFTIEVSSLAQGHSERNHHLENSKKQYKVLRDIFFSQTWMSSVTTPLACTNVYIFLKKSSGDFLDNLFVAAKPLCLPPKIKHTVIKLNNLNGEMNCCDVLEVFDDLDKSAISPRKKENLGGDSSIDNSIFWSQSNVLVQGFKDCFINKVSASELW